jgi:hypothetical protein
MHFLFANYFMSYIYIPLYFLCLNSLNPHFFRMKHPLKKDSLKLFQCLGYTSRELNLISLLPQSVTSNSVPQAHFIISEQGIMLVGF